MSNQLKLSALVFAAVTCTAVHAQSGTDAAGAHAAARGQATSNVTGKSNNQQSQPARIEDSYPLKSDADRQKTVAVVQQLTVDLLATFNNYKEAHWNLNGPLYLVLHEYYQEQADYYRMEADIFAERALHMGYSVDGRYVTIAKTTRIPSMPPGTLTDNETLKDNIDRVTVLQKEIYEGIDKLDKSDPTTANKLQDLAYAVDKNLWQLRVHIVKPGGKGEDLVYSDQQTPAPAPKQ